MNAIAWTNRGCFDFCAICGVFVCLCARTRARVCVHVCVRSRANIQQKRVHLLYMIRLFPQASSPSQRVTTTRARCWRAAASTAGAITSSGSWGRATRATDTRRLGWRGWGQVGEAERLCVCVYEHIYVSLCLCIFFYNIVCINVKIQRDTYIHLFIV